MGDPHVTTVRLARLADGAAVHDDDAVAVERALEIRVAGRAVAVTLRTPGDDVELALGFLAGEGLIGSRADVAAAVAQPADCDDRPDGVEVTLAAGVPFDWTRLERHFAATAACGLCGRAHIESLRAGITPLPASAPVAADALLRLASEARARQGGFEATGGLHAAVWADGAVAPRVLREDVGRHNAVDKLAGWLLQQGTYPADTGVVWVSGRAGAEIVLKTARARVPVLAAVGAPSSLAIELARTAEMTLVGFLREGRMNVYCGLERIRP